MIAFTLDGGLTGCSTNKHSGTYTCICGSCKECGLRSCTCGISLFYVAVTLSVASKRVREMVGFLRDHVRTALCVHSRNAGIVAPRIAFENEINTFLSPYLRLHIKRTRSLTQSIDAICDYTNANFLNYQMAAMRLHFNRYGCDAWILTLTLNTTFT